MMLDESRLVGKDTVGVPNSSEVRYCCQFCDDTKFHLYVNRVKRLFHCFKCGVSGKITSDETQYFLNDFEEINNALYSWSRREVKITKPPSIIKTLPRSLDFFTFSYLCEDSPVRKRALEYLSSRGLASEEIKNNGIRWCLDRSGIYTDCIVFPIHTDVLQYFVARKIVQSKYKYINAPWPKGGLFYRAYNKDFFLKVKGVVLCEGPFDAIKIARCGFRAWAILGKKLTLEQIKTLGSVHPKKIIICLDPDAYWPAIRVKLEIISHYPDIQVEVLHLNLDKDPGEYPTEKLRKELEDASLLFGS
jgi:DNA primase